MAKKVRIHVVKSGMVGKAPYRDGKFLETAPIFLKSAHFPPAPLLMRTMYSQAAIRRGLKYGNM